MGQHAEIEDFDVNQLLVPIFMNLKLKSVVFLVFCCSGMPVSGWGSRKAKLQRFSMPGEHAWALLAVAQRVALANCV